MPHTGGGGGGGCVLFWSMLLSNLPCNLVFVVVGGTGGGVFVYFISCSLQREWVGY